MAAYGVMDPRTRSGNPSWDGKWGRQTNDAMIAVRQMDLNYYASIEQPAAPAATQPATMPRIQSTPRTQPVGTGRAGLPPIPAMPTKEGMTSKAQRVGWLDVMAAHAIQAKLDTGHSVFISTQLGMLTRETGWGHSVGYREDYNLFGLKAWGSEPGRVHNTREQTASGTDYRVNARFAVYQSYYEAFAAMGLKITNSPKRYTYAAAATTPFDQLSEIRGKAERGNEYGGWATENREDYVGDISDTMRRYRLDRYDAEYERRKALLERPGE